MTSRIHELDALSLNSRKEPRLVVSRGSFIVGSSSNTQSYSEYARVYGNLSWDVQQRAYQTPAQVIGIALVLRFGPEPRDAAAPVERNIVDTIYMILT
jgi:hypothetical protein